MSIKLLSKPRPTPLQSHWLEYEIPKTIQFHEFLFSPQLSPGVYSYPYKFFLDALEVIPDLCFPSFLSPFHFQYFRSYNQEYTMIFARYLLIRMNIGGILELSQQLF